MKAIYAAALSLIAGVVQAAETVPSLHVPTGGAVVCTPSPSIETLNRITLYEDGKLLQTSRVSCFVTDHQALPKHSKFIGYQVAGPVPNSYTFVWAQLQFPRGFSVRTDNSANANLSTTAGDSGTLRITFENGLDITLYGELSEILQP